MGGIGSGRQCGYSYRSTTEDYRSIDIRRWRRDGLLEPWRTFGWQWSLDGEAVASIRVQAEDRKLRLMYRQRSAGEEWRDMDYTVFLDWTDCHLGGSRPWFLCPARGCGRRVAILFGGAVFVCRHCHQLAYPSQNEDASDRAARRAERIRAKLGWPPSILNGWHNKPKGMHWRTFERLCQEHEYWETMSLGFIAAKFGMPMPASWDRLLARYAEGVSPNS